MEDMIESIHKLLMIGIVAANIIVWWGVYLEGDKFPEDVKNRGWKILLIGLAAEAAFGFLLPVVDTFISNKQKADIAALYVRATNAENDTAKLKQSTTLLDARAKEAVAEAAKANERTETLKKVVGWRQLSPKQFETLADELAKARGSVTIAYAPFDPEVGTFTPQIVDAFVAAIRIASGTEHSKAIHVTERYNPSPKDSWNLSVEPRLYTKLAALNVAIPGPENATVLAIRAAFSAAGIQFVTGDIPFPAETTTGGIIAPPRQLQTDALIMVGSKPLMLGEGPSPF